MYVTKNKINLYFEIYVYYYPYFVFIHVITYSISMFILFV